LTGLDFQHPEEIQGVAGAQFGGVAPVTRTGFSGMRITSEQKIVAQDDDGGSRFNSKGKCRPKP